MRIELFTIIQTQIEEIIRDVHFKCILYERIRQSKIRSSAVAVESVSGNALSRELRDS